MATEEGAISRRLSSIGRRIRRAFLSCLSGNLNYFAIPRNPPIISQPPPPRQMSTSSVRLFVQERQVVIDNGILRITLSNPEGIVTGIQYNGVDNLLEVLNKEENRGYWDLVWNDPGGKGIFDVIKGTEFMVILENECQVEVSFKRMWVPSLQGRFVPLNIDKRFVVLKGCSGFYTYGIYEHQQGWPDFNLGETRVTFKLRKDRFHYMAISDDRQRIMPMPDDRMPARCKQLGYPEAVLLTNPINPYLQGEVDDKYQYSCENKDNKVHGWISLHPPIGFWQITPSNEFRTGGPFKQNLTSHVGPTTLAMFCSAHYAGEDLVPKFRNGEYWKKVFGPVLIYLNSCLPGTDPKILWEDASMQMQVEVSSWPYNFPMSEDFQKPEQRGAVSGRLWIRDRYHLHFVFYMGILDHGRENARFTWETTTLFHNAFLTNNDLTYPKCIIMVQGYQFWTVADDSGLFFIKTVLSGDYNLYAWIVGVIGDYRYDTVITINPGDNIDLGDLVYEPPRDGPTLWEIGVPDRSAAEFYIPDPNPTYVNRLFVNHSNHRFRQYGLWERYTDLYPDGDLVYIVGVSDYKRDWFFAHVNRADGNSFKATTWQIRFTLSDVDPSGHYKLRIAIASATYAELQVRFNDREANPAHFTTRLIGRDNSIARHGIHGLYCLFNIDVKGKWLVSRAENVIFLTQTRTVSPFQGIMYDYLRFEGLPR